MLSLAVRGHGPAKICLLCRTTKSQTQNAQQKTQELPLTFLPLGELHISNKPHVCMLFTSHTFFINPVKTATNNSQLTSSFHTQIKEHTTHWSIWELLKFVT
jgi:hypothetical protein